MVSESRDLSNDYKIYVGFENNQEEKEGSIVDIFRNNDFNSLNRSNLVVVHHKRSFYDLFMEHSHRTGKFGPDLYGHENAHNSGYISKQVYSKLQNKNAKPSKLVLIILCFLFELNYDQSVELLASCHEEFRVYCKLDDAAVQYIKAGEYDLEKFDESLYEDGIASLLDSKRIPRDYYI